MKENNTNVQRNLTYQEWSELTDEQKKERELKGLAHDSSPPVEGDGVARQPTIQDPVPQRTPADDEPKDRGRIQTSRR